jgi:hypothetical protein
MSNYKISNYTILVNDCTTDFPFCWLRKYKEGHSDLLDEELTESVSSVLDGHSGIEQASCILMILPPGIVKFPCSRVDERRKWGWHIPVCVIPPHNLAVMSGISLSIVMHCVRDLRHHKCEWWRRKHNTLSVTRLEKSTARCTRALIVTVSKQIERRAEIVRVRRLLSQIMDSVGIYFDVFLSVGAEQNHVKSGDLG